MPWFLKCYKKYNHQYIAWREQPDSSDPHSQVGLSFNGNKKTFHSCPVSCDWKHWTEHLQFPLSEVQEKLWFISATERRMTLSISMAGWTIQQSEYSYSDEREDPPLSYQWKADENDAIDPFSRKFSLLKNYNRTIALKQCWTKRRSDASPCGSISWIQNQDILF